MTPLKVCGCCGTTYTRDEWTGLPWVGMQPPDSPELELRNFRCHSTLAVPLDGWSLAEESEA